MDLKIWYCYFRCLRHLLFLVKVCDYDVKPKWCLLSVMIKRVINTNVNLIFVQKWAKLKAKNLHRYPSLNLTHKALIPTLKNKLKSPSQNRRKPTKAHQRTQRLKQKKKKKRKGERKRKIRKFKKKTSQKNKLLNASPNQRNKVLKTGSKTKP